MWLHGNLVFWWDDIDAEPSTSSSAPSAKPGRPKSLFANCCAKVKRRKVQGLVESNSYEELATATEIKLRKAGKRDSATIVEELATASPQRGTQMKKALKKQEEKPRMLSADEALVMIVDANLSSHQYNVIRQQAKTLNNDLYPPYYKVKEAKKLCYPAGMVITEVSAEIPVQALIDHTISRLCKVQKEVIESLSDIDRTNIKCIIKWGCDGAEQNKYRQRFSEEHHTDESLFTISMMPIQIYCGAEANRKIIWQNGSPSSTRYCRPIKFIFGKETVQLITAEVNKVETQIAALSPTRIELEDSELFVKSIMILCMIDGKVCNAVSSCASTQTCYLCGAKPRDMNNSNGNYKKTPDLKFLAIGLSPLHAWIRCFECLLHIAYRLEIKSWQARGSENKDRVQERKTAIQNKFKKELGVLVDMPKQGTSNTNDGNTARKFFRNAEMSTEITGLNVELIEKFHIILESINSGYAINLDKFERHAKETRELYLREYPWYLMPVTAHKIPCHGRDIIAACILPIGQFSEEAQEARNKDSRKYRELFTRKTSRVATNSDLLNRLLITSDPFIAFLRVAPKTKHHILRPEVIDLLEESPHFSAASDYDCRDSDDTDTDYQSE